VFVICMSKENFLEKRKKLCTRDQHTSKAVIDEEQARTHSNLRKNHKRIAGFILRVLVGLGCFKEFLFIKN
jgi:hypothetical protein